MPLIRLKCSGKLIPAIDTIAASSFPLSDDWLPLWAICSGSPIEMDKPPLFCSKQLKTNLWNLKDEVPLNFQKNTQQPNSTLISIDWYYFWPSFSTGPAAVPGGRSSPPLLAGGVGEGDPPLCIGKQEVGTYIYSLLDTHTGLLGRLLLKFYSR